MTQENRHNQERAPRTKETGHEVVEPAKEEAEAKGAGEEAEKEMTIQPFIPARELKQTYGVFGHFYSVELFKAVGRGQ